MRSSSSFPPSSAAELFRPPLIVFVGSRTAGRMVHLNRLIERSRIYAPLLTVTTRVERKPGDDTWFIRESTERVGSYTTDQMLTFFHEGHSRYFVLHAHYWLVSAQGKIPLVWMTSAGLETLALRQGAQNAIPFSVIALEPTDETAFCETLQRDRGFDPEEAVTETKRAVRLSQIPPAMDALAIRIPVTGTAEDDSAVDRALSALTFPP